MAADEFAALLRRQSRFQRRADQLIPEQRDLLRPLPAFHRVLIEGVHHSADPNFVVGRITRQVLPGNDPRDDPGPAVPPSGATRVGRGTHRTGGPTR